MKPIGRVMQHPERPVTRPREFGQGGDVRCFEKDGGTQACLTPQELGAVGYREVPGPDGTRVGQFGLCRDAAGEWVYSPLKRPDETVEDMLWRNAEARRQMERCPRKRDSGKLRGFDE